MDCLFHGEPTATGSVEHGGDLQRCLCTSRQPPLPYELSWSSHYPVPGLVAVLGLRTPVVQPCHWSWTLDLLFFILLCNTPTGPGGLEVREPQICYPLISDYIFPLPEQCLGTSLCAHTQMARRNKDLQSLVRLSVAIRSQPWVPSSSTAHRSFEKGRLTELGACHFS